MNALAWSLVHFLWQGAAVAALAAALMFAFKSPSTRYLVGVGALALMLMSFAVTFSILSDSAGNGAETPARLPAPVAANTWVIENSAPLSSTATPAAGAGDFLWVARAWLVGVFALALRIVFGLLVLDQLRRRGLIALPEHLVARFRVLQERVGIRRLVRYCECQAVRVPAVIGLFRPIVLIPVRALTGLSPEQLDAVVAHELGHIKRLDVAVNFVQAIAETLFFFHPAVWWLNKRIRADREDCCDDVAVSVCGGSVGYARALATMATWRDAPQFAMAATGGPIAARVARLLGLRAQDGSERTARVFTASLVLAAALVAGALSFGVVRPAQAQSAVPVPTPAPAASPSPMVSPQPVIPVRVESAESPANPPSPAAPAAPPVKAKPPRKAAPAAPAAPAVPARPATARGSYIEDMKSAGYADLDVDQLIAFKNQGITPDYVRDMRATGLDPNANELIAMKVQDITPEYVKQVRDMGFKPDTNEIIAMKVQDITPAYVRELRDLNFDVDANQIIAMKVQDITPDYVRQMRSAGFDADVNELIAMKVQDVTPEYRKQFEAAGYKLDANQLIQAKVMGVTPEFIAKAASHGFKNLDFNKLIQLKNADIL
jgi:beta-lactamase regulating signal transducer with metallopeptidase domain/sporulation protein YlmC with PRC-barrel domain